MQLREKCYDSKGDKKIMCLKDGYVIFHNS